MAAKTSEPVLIFERYLEQLSSLAYLKSLNEKTQVSNILQQLIKVHLPPDSTINNDKALLAIYQCCAQTSHEDGNLVQLVLNFMQKLDQAHVKIEGQTLTVAVGWTIASLSSKNSELVYGGLQVLQALIRQKCLLLGDLAEKIVNISQNLLESSHKNETPVFLGSLTCLEALNNYKENDPVNTGVCEKSCDIFLKFLYNPNVIESPLMRNKCIVTAIRGLENIVQAKVVTSEIPEILGIVKCYMLYQIPGYEEIRVEKVVATTLAVPEEPSTGIKPTGKYDRKPKKQATSAISDITCDESDTGYKPASETEPIKLDITSESDFSDSEGGKAAKIRKSQTKVRRCSLILLERLFLKGESNVLTRYLTTLFETSRSLPICLLKETSCTCRSEVLVVLNIILAKFKRFFLLADSMSKSSFTTLANTIAEILLRVEKSLITALEQENYKVVSVQILKCLSLLIRCTPYHKINGSPLVSIAQAVAPFLKKPDVNLRVAALVVFGCITTIKPFTEDVRSVVCQESGCPWLFQQCFALLTEEKGYNPAVAVECLQVTAALVRSFPSDILVHHEKLSIVLGCTSEKFDYLVRLYTAKLTQAIVEAVQNSITSQNRDGISPALAVSTWTSLIFPAVASLLECEEHPSLRSSACDTLACLPVNSEHLDVSIIYDELPRQNQILGITHILGCTKDDNVQVRCSALRALAAFLTFARLRSDGLFFMDAVDVFFKSAKDENVGVRIQSAWLLSHIVTAAKENEEDGLDEEFSESILHKLLDAAVILAHDNKKGKPYAVRAVAGLLCLIPEEDISQNKEVINRCIEALISTATTGTFMKARWNGCYALGTVLARAELCVIARQKALPALWGLVHNYKNFKVRISAAQALSSPPSRESYGELYLPTWRSLLQALENTENLADLTEFKHRDNLVDELCLGLCGMLSVALKDDISQLQDVFQQYKDIVRHNMERFKNRVMPEKAVVLLKAEENLRLLEKVVDRGHIHAFKTLQESFASLRIE